jgi:hypothetical protein
VEVAERKNLRIRLTPELKDRIEEVAQRKRVSQQVLVDAVLEWFVGTDGLLQSLILGQIDPEDEAGVSEVALRRIAARRKEPVVVGHKGQPPKPRPPRAAS